MSARALLLLAALAACGAEIVEQPSDDAAGSSTTTTSSSSSSSMSSAGGGGAGGATAVPVPGCEKLALHPEQLIIPDSTVGYLLPLDGQDLAVVYRTWSHVPDKLWDTRSRRLLGPFDAWPPSITDPLIHGVHQIWTEPHHAPPHARSDGAFVYENFLQWSVSSVYDATVDVRAPAGMMYEAYPILEPSPGLGVFWSHEGSLAYYPTLDAEEPSFTDTLPTAMNERAHGLAFDGTLILQDGDALYVNDGGWTPFATPPELTPGGHAFPRPGGFYWRPNDSLMLYPYAGAEPLAPLSPLGSGVMPVFLQDHAGPWRDGAVVVTVTMGPPDAKALHIAVTDDEHTTYAVHTHAEIGIETNGVSVVASPDGDSVYVGYLQSVIGEPTTIAYAVSRFDCVTP